MEELIEKLVDEIGLKADEGLASSALEKIVRSYYEEKNKSTAQNEDENQNHEADQASSETAQAPQVVVDEPLLLSVLNRLSQHPNIEVKPEESHPDDPSPLRSIYTASEEQVWKSITGHGIDTARVPISQWELLMVIAAAGPAGVLQPETTRVTGQDKRSVPMRTDRLAENGYIDKEAVSAKGQRTSLLRLRRWRGLQVVSDNAPDSTGKRPMIFYSSWFDDTMRMLKENGGIKTMDDLRTGLGIVAKHRETKIYLRAIHRIADAGCVRRLTARVLDAEGNEVSMRTGPPRTARAIQLLREPTAKDRAIWIKHGNTKERHDSDSDDEGNAQAFGEKAGAADGDAAATLSSTRPAIKRSRRERKKAAKRAAKKSSGAKSRPIEESEEEEEMDDDEETDVDAEELTTPAVNTVAATRQKRSSSKRMSYQLPDALDADSDGASEADVDGNQEVPPTTSPKRARKKTAKAAEYETTRAAREHARPRRVSAASPVEDDDDDDVPPSTNPYISITDDALEFTPLDAHGNVGPSLGVDWKPESTSSTPRAVNPQLGKKRGPYRKRDPDAIPKARKRVEIPPEEFAEFDKFAQLTAERKVRAEFRSSRKRGATEAQLDDVSQRPEKTARLAATADQQSESIPAEDLPADRVAAVKKDILAREQPGVYINPPGARNLKLESFVSRGRPRNTLIAVVKSDRLHELDLFKPGDGLPRFAPKPSQRRTARIGIAAGLAVSTSDFFVDGSDSEGEKGTPTPARTSEPALNSDLVDSDSAAPQAKRLKRGAEVVPGPAGGMGRFRLLPSGADFMNPAFVPPSSRKTSDEPFSATEATAIQSSEGEVSALVKEVPTLADEEPITAAGNLASTPQASATQPSATLTTPADKDTRALRVFERDILKQSYVSPATKLTALNAAIATIQKKRGRRTEKDRIRLQLLLRHQKISQQAALNDVGPGAADELQYLLHGKEGISEEELARVNFLRQRLNAGSQNDGVQLGAAQSTTPANAPSRAQGDAAASSSRHSLVVKSPSLRGTPNTSGPSSLPEPPSMKSIFRVKFVPQGAAANTNGQPVTSEPRQIAGPAGKTAKFRHYQGPKQKDVETPPAVPVPSITAATVPTPPVVDPAQPVLTSAPVPATMSATTEPSEGGQPSKANPVEPIPTYDQAYVLAHKGEQFYHRGHGRFSRGVKPVKPVAEKSASKKKPSSSALPSASTEHLEGFSNGGPGATATVTTTNDAALAQPSQSTPQREASLPATPVQGQAGYQPPKTYTKAYVNAHPELTFYHRGGGRYCLGEKPSKQAAHVPRAPAAQDSDALDASSGGPNGKAAVSTIEGQTEPQGSNTQLGVASASSNASLAPAAERTLVPEPDTTAGATHVSMSAHSTPGVTTKTSVLVPENDSAVAESTPDAAGLIEGLTGSSQAKPAPKRKRTHAPDAVQTFTYEYVLAHPDEIFHNRGHGNYARGPHPTNLAYNTYKEKDPGSAAVGSPARSTTPHVSEAAEPGSTISSTGEALFTSNYVNSHPDETFHHRGGGKWARGLPPAGVTSKRAVRGPGAKDYKPGSAPSTPQTRGSSAIGRQTTPPRTATGSASATPQRAAMLGPPVQVSPLLNIFRPYSSVASVPAPQQIPGVVASTESRVQESIKPRTTARASNVASNTDEADAAPAVHEDTGAGAEVENDNDADADGEVDDDLVNREVAKVNDKMDIEWTPVADVEDTPMDDDDDWDDTPRRRRGPQNPRVAGFNPELDFPLDEAVVVRSSIVASVLPVGENSAASPKRVFSRKPITTSKKASNGSRRSRQESSSDDSDSDVSPEQAKLQGTMQMSRYRHDLSYAMQPKIDKARISRRLRFDDPRRPNWSMSMSSLVEVYGKEESRQHSSLLMHPTQTFHESSGTFATAGAIAPPPKTLEDEFKEAVENPSTPRTRVRKSKAVVPPAQRLLVKLKVPNLASLDLDFERPPSPASSELQRGSPATLAGNQTLGGTKRPYNWRPKQVSFQTPLDDAEDDPTFIEDDALVELSDEDVTDDDAFSDASGAGQSTDRVRRKQPKLASGDIRRRDRQSGALFKDSDRLVVAYALVATLCGGINQDRINWNLVAHALSFRYDGEFLRRRWVHVRRTRMDEVGTLRDAIHEPFLQAYERNQLPRVDFADLVNTDWPALFEWVYQNVAPHASLHAVSGLQADMPKNPDLPASRAALIENFQIEVPDQPYQLHLDEYFTATTDIARKYLATNFHYGVPLVRQLKAGDEATDNLLLLKSWVRAVAVTKQRYYNAEAAAKKLRMFNPNLLQKVTTWMIEKRFFAQERKGRHLPGRNFQVHNDVLTQFRRWPARPDESRFLRFVAQAWSTISRHFDYNTSLNLIPAATDPEYLVLTNMVASGLIRVKTILPEPDYDFDAPFPRLSPWGYCGDSYETKKVDMKRLRFPLVYEKTPNFSPQHGLRPNVPIPLFPPVPFPGEQSLGPRIPFWVDIHGNLIHDVWDMVLRSILHLLVFRPGVTSKGMADFHANKLWEWEIALALSWLEKTGVAVRTSAGGWKAGVYWFCLFSKEVAVWEGPEL